MKLDLNRQAFFELLQAGLWEKEARIDTVDKIDFDALYELAEEQTVVGLIAAGLGHLRNMRPPKKDVMKFIGQTMLIEQRNKEMNCFIGKITDMFRKEGIVSVLMKGQGIAQCYERPLWRASGDIDFLFNYSNYQKAKELLLPLTVSSEKEDRSNLHLGMTIDQWVVELHGTLRTLLWESVSRTLDAIQQEICEDAHVKAWHICETAVLVPDADEDAFYIFTHFIGHFYKGGIGLRQICDWCRLLLSYRDAIDVTKLESRLRQARLVEEWKAFAALAVEWLGMPAGVMPLYSQDRRWHQKASRIIAFILETGNFGNNRDSSYYSKYGFFFRKTISLWRYTRDSIQHFFIFPQNSVRVWCNRLYISAKVASKELKTILS